MAKSFSEISQKHFPTNELAEFFIEKNRIGNIDIGIIKSKLELTR